MRNQPPGQPVAPPKLSYVDRPEIDETFVDSVARLAFDGGTLRIEFTVNRLDDTRPPAPPTGRATTACRLVLTAPGMLDLYGRLSALMNALQSQGVLKSTPPESAPPTS